MHIISNLNLSYFEVRQLNAAICEANLKNIKFYSDVIRAGSHANQYKTGNPFGIDVTVYVVLTDIYYNRTLIPASNACLILK